MRLAAMILLLSILSLSCTKEESFSNQSLELKSTREKFSYALGYDFGPSMEHIKTGVDLQLFMRGLEDYFNNKAPLLTKAERQTIRSQEFDRIGKEYIERKKEEERKNLEAAQAFLAENKTKSGVMTTASGLQYLTLAEGHGPKPGLDDKVKVKYRGTFIDGSEFESTEKSGGRPSTFLVKGVFAGWSEGFQLMRVGGKYRFFTPPHLAYGEIGRQPDIPPNSTLIYDIELLEIVTGRE